MTMEIREFAIRALEAAERTVSGIAVPWEQVVEIGGMFREVFSRGSVIDSDNAMLFWRHQEPIGKIVSARDTDEGWEITARISETPRGEEAYTLLRDGVIEKFSIGFEPVEHLEEEDGTIRRTKVRAREVSLVPIPAYSGASVSEVRENQTISKERNMTEQSNVTDLAEVRESIEMLERTISTLQAPAEVEVVDTRSAGEILKGIVEGDESAKRAYTGGTSADAVVKNGYVGDLTRIIEAAAPMLNAFSTGNLPSEGNYLEYAQLKSNTITAGVQAAEGDDLVFGKIQQELKTAAVRTLGGYTSLTRQEIERSSVNILDASLRAQAISVGKATNILVRNAYVAEHALQVTADNVVEIPSTGATYADWLAAAIDASVKFDALGLPLEALVVDTATFKSLTTLVGEDGRPVFLVTGAGTNNVGNLNVRGLRGDLANIPVILDAGLAADKNAFVNTSALRTYRSPVVRLQDENIINLTKDFSVYTYAAVANEIPAAIVPVVEAV